MNKNERIRANTNEALLPVTEGALTFPPVYPTNGGFSYMNLVFSSQLKNVFNLLEIVPKLGTLLRRGVSGPWMDLTS